MCVDGRGDVVTDVNCQDSNKPSKRDVCQQEPCSTTPRTTHSTTETTLSTLRTSTRTSTAITSTETNTPAYSSSTRSNEINSYSRHTQQSMSSDQLDPRRAQQSMSSDQLDPRRAQQSMSSDQLDPRRDQLASNEHDAIYDAIRDASDNKGRYSPRSRVFSEPVMRSAAQTQEQKQASWRTGSWTQVSALLTSHTHKRCILSHVFIRFDQELPAYSVQRNTPVIHSMVHRALYRRL